jgi:large subunit ribosomal protein L12
MDLVYAAMLLHETKQPIDEAHVAKVLTAAGATADSAKIKALVASLEGVNIADVISKAAMPVAAAAPVATAAPAEKKEEKKEEDEKKKAEEAVAGLGALFG